MRAEEKKSENSNLYVNNRLMHPSHPIVSIFGRQASYSIEIHQPAQQVTSDGDLVRRATRDEVVEAVIARGMTH